MNKVNKKSDWIKFLKLPYILVNSALCSDLISVSAPWTASWAEGGRGRQKAQ